MSSLEWLVGVGINATGAVITNLGTILMKQRHLKRGLSLFALGSVLTFLSFSFAAQSLLAGVSAIQFISNLVFARFILKEKITKRNLIGTGILILGITLLIFASEKGKVFTDIDEVFEDYYFAKTHLIFLFSIGGVVTILSTLFWFRIGLWPFWYTSTTQEQQIMLELSLPRSRGKLTSVLIPLVFIKLSAIIGAQSVVSGKVMSCVVKAVIGSGQYGQLLKLRSYLVFSLWLACAIFWVIHLSRSLRVFHGGFIIPLSQVCWTLWTMMSGGIVYGEFLDIDSWRIILFVLGALLLFSGVSLLTPASTKKPSAVPFEDTVTPTSSNKSLNTQKSFLENFTAVPVLTNPQTPQAIKFTEDLIGSIPEPPYFAFKRTILQRHNPIQSSNVPDGIPLGHPRV
jgi:Magnesium transporter NIPA